MSDGKIEPPNTDDIARIGRMLFEANRSAVEIIGEEFKADAVDIDRLQSVIESGSVQRDATYILQTLGFVNSERHFRIQREGDQC